MVKRHQIEHIIRSATNVVDKYEILIIGSQSILGKYPNPPHPLDESMEVDVIIQGESHLSEIIDGAIGEGSPFHNHFGYHAHGVDESTAILPEGWKSRLHKIQNENTDLRIGWCLDPVDLACAKLMAHREKDLSFVKGLLENKLCRPEEVVERLRLIHGHEQKIEKAMQFISSWHDRHVVAGHSFDIIVGIENQGDVKP
jgi:hypothetical protein